MNKETTVSDLDRIRTHDAKDGSLQFMEVLRVGTRIRSKQHPKLTGYVKAHEYHESGRLSPIPYLIGWDDSDVAYRVLGSFFVYASVGGIEASTEPKEK